MASTVAMFEPNLKRLLAWSSVAQIGYITLGASLVSIAGLTASPAVLVLALVLLPLHFIAFARLWGVKLPR